MNTFKINRIGFYIADSNFNYGDGYGDGYGYASYAGFGHGDGAEHGFGNGDGMGCGVAPIEDDNYEPIQI